MHLWWMMINILNISNKKIKIKILSFGKEWVGGPLLIAYVFLILMGNKYWVNFKI